MRKILFSFCLLFSLLMIQSSISAQHIEAQLKEEIEKIIKYETNIDFDKTPGFIISIIDQDTSFHIPFGSQVDQREAILPEDIFELGSCSKAFVAHYIIETCKHLNIPLDAHIQAYVSDEIINEKIGNLTFRDLLTHRTKFPKKPAGFGLSESNSENPYSNYSRHNFIAYLNSINFSLQSDRCSYSHVNYGLLEEIAANLIQNNSAITIEDWLKSKKLYNSSFASNDSLEIGFTKRRTISTPWTYQSFSFSEGLKSNAQDINIFINYLIDLEQDVWEPFVDSKCPTIYSDDFYTSLGWTIIENEAKFDIFALTGATDGHSSFIAFIKETKTAVIILANSATGTDKLGMSILRMINKNWKRKS